MGRAKAVLGEVGIHEEEEREDGLQEGGGGGVGLHGDDVLQTSSGEQYGAPVHSLGLSPSASTGKRTTFGQGRW